MTIATDRRVAVAEWAAGDLDALAAADARIRATTRALREAAGR